jgi:DNA-binding transcriptional ArsR family regulator
MHVFTLLGDPVRLRIVELLGRGEQPVWKLVDVLTDEFGISRSAVSHQLRALRDERFVIARVEGSVRRYRLAWNAMELLDEAVEALFVVWEQRDRWPYQDLLELETEKLMAGKSLDPPRRHRAGRVELRGRTEEDIEPRQEGDDWMAGWG